MVAFDANTALIVVDAQNDFVDPKGSLCIVGAVDRLPAIRDLIQEAQRHGAFVVYTQDWHPLTTKHFEKWPPHCVQRTWGAEFHPGVDITGPVVRKGVNGEDGYSGFTAHDLVTNLDLPTGLQQLLMEQSIDTLVIVGFALDVCVKATGLDALKLGYEEVFIPLSATAAVSDSSTEELERAGAIILP